MNFKRISMSSSQLLAQVLSKQRQHFINGQFTPSLHAATAKATPGACGGSIAVVNPATESILSNIARGGPLDVEASVAAAKKALESGSPWAESSGRVGNWE